MKRDRKDLTDYARISVRNLKSFNRAGVFLVSGVPGEIAEVLEDYLDACKQNDSLRKQVAGLRRVIVQDHAPKLRRLKGRGAR